VVGAETLNLKTAKPPFKLFPLRFKALQQMHPASDQRETTPGRQDLGFGVKGSGVEF
jgi:hypothetical protein